jgi:hypothetical protein
MAGVPLTKRACALAGLVVLAFAAPATAADAPAPPGLRHLVGSMHEHSAYSDGWPGTRPFDYYESGARHGLDFMAGSDHSDNMGLPVVLSQGCLGDLAGQCALADQVNPADSFRKWDATAEQAAAVSAAHPGFATLRGFEWSSDRYGHISVYGSTNWTSAYADGGFVDMRTFWSWFTRPATLGGGSDGIATFNHPGAKKIDFTGDPSATGFNWDDFAYVPAADERMVGIEVFNDRTEYGSKGGPYPEGSYAHALDKGWHVGASGAEDLGHNKPPTDDWGGPPYAKTVVLAPASTPAAIHAALLDRRFYAVGPGEQALRLSFTVDGEPMGARLDRASGDRLRVRARASDPGVSLELVTSGGKQVAAGDDVLNATRRAAPGERYYFVRARRGATIVGYTSPVWVEAADGATRGTWFAGDGHVHTCYSHDAYCGPADDNTGPDTAYSSGGTVAQRFAEGAAKGLDFLSISDHDDVRAQSDPDYGSQGVAALPAYEASLAGGHAHMLGATHLYPKGDTVPASAVRSLADSLRADGGRFQANHPSYKAEAPFDSCDQADGPDPARIPLHWKYGFSVQPDSIEVWNATTLLQPAELYWECWLQRGVRVGATAGSDSHGATQPNLGMPTEWVLARSRRPRDLLAAIGAGRTTLSRNPPALGGVRLLLEGDADRDGSFESAIGDSVPPGTPLRVRAEGGAPLGWVRVRANGETLVDARALAPGGSVTFAAPAAGWVRASLYLADGTQAVDPGCRPIGQPLDTCTRDLAVAAMTSPVYVGRGSGGEPLTSGPSVAQDPAAVADEPDDDPPMGAVQQSGGASALPVVPPASRSLSALRARALRRCARGRRSVPVRVAWRAAGAPVDVQVRSGRRWRTVRRAVRASSVRVRVACGPRAVRLRARVRGGAWRVVVVRLR